VEDILEDEEASFEATDTYYVFSTKTTYQNNQSLPFQEIYLDKKTFTPVYVKIMDIDQNVLVEVTFTDFELNPTFSGNEFVVEDILDEGSQETLQPDLAEETDEEMNDESFPILFPLFTAGAELYEKKTVQLEEGERVIMTFTGDKNFTLVQEKSTVLPTTSYPKVIQGDIVNLGFTIGALSEISVEWSYQGVDFYLASDILTEDEFIEVAQSVQGREAK